MKINMISQGSSPHPRHGLVGPREAGKEVPGAAEDVSEAEAEEAALP